MLSELDGASSERLEPMTLSKYVLRFVVDPDFLIHYYTIVGTERSQMLVVAKLF